MVQARMRAWLSTMTLVVGALLIGDAIHGVITIGAYGFTSPAAVIRVVVGVALVAVGARLRTPAEEYVSSVSGELEDGKTAPPESGTVHLDSEFDSSLSPVGEVVENAECDDARAERDAEG